RKMVRQPEDARRSSKPYGLRSAIVGILTIFHPPSFSSPASRGAMIFSMTPGGRSRLFAICRMYSSLLMRAMVFLRNGVTDGFKTSGPARTLAASISASPTIRRVFFAERFARNDAFHDFRDAVADFESNHIAPALVERRVHTVAVMAVQDDTGVNRLGG